MLDKVLNIIESFNKHEVDYVIIGGYAVIMHGFLRATEDIDIMLLMSNENITRFQKALYDVYAEKEIDELSFDELEKYPVIRYGTPDNFYIDIISGLGTKFSYEDIEIEKKVVDKVEVKFASVKSLIEMKKNTYREKDKIDLLFLNEKQKND